MSSPPTLDLDALVAPVPGPDPAGSPEPPEVDLQLKRLRADIVSQDETSADGDLVEGPGTRTRWGEVVAAAAEVLTTKSKHVEAAARLVEAATRKDGIAGLRDGLRLLQRLAAECWDRVHPLPEEGSDYDPREGRLRWLNDVSSGAQFPYAITRQPIVRTRDKEFCYLNWLRKESKEEFEAAIPKVDPVALRGYFADLQEARQALHDLTTVIDQRLGDDAPDFLSESNPSNIGTAVERGIGLVEEVARRAGISLTETTPTTTAAATSSETAAAAPTGPVDVATVGARRADLYRQLGQIASALRVIEPHSPIPFLLDRCVRLGDLQFPDLMRAIVRESNTLDELDRLLGTEKPSS